VSELYFLKKEFVNLAEKRGRATLFPQRAGFSYRPPFIIFKRGRGDGDKKVRVTSQ
jgi:hypothetical protein